ncbi:FAD-dependent oxidoreductase, partial [Escherichia coli]
MKFRITSSARNAPSAKTSLTNWHRRQNEQRHCDHWFGLRRPTTGEKYSQTGRRLFPHTWVTDIDAEARVVKSQNNQWQYDKLVLATGASAFVPPVPGRELMLTLNSQQEYRACETQLRDARRVLIVGGGLIGSELAMDFCRAGKAVTLIDNAASILASLMPPEVSSRLQHRLTEMGVHLLL